VAKIFLKGGTEKCLINAVRQAYFQPFRATNWLDLRVGFFLSVCGNADPSEDDTITGLDEEIDSTTHFLPFSDRVAIGIVNSSDHSVFLGYTNIFLGHVQGMTVGTTQLISSDEGIGTDNANFWRFSNSRSSSSQVKILDGDSIRARGTDNSQMHLVQDTTGAGGYATLVMLRFQRDDYTGRRKIIRMSVKIGDHNGDVLYTNTPTEASLQSNLESFPETVQTLGPVELSQEPDMLWIYWPFRMSRIRTHCYGILRAS